MRTSDYFNLPMVFVFLGALLSAVGGLFAAYRQNQEKLRSAVDRAAFEKELRAKSDEIAGLNRQISASIIGGDSYCYVRLLLDKTDAAVAIVVHEGKYPLYDIKIRMWDPRDYAERALSYKDLIENNREYNFTPGNLAPSHVSVLGRVQLAHSEANDFALVIGARNGFLSETIKLRRVNGEWKAAYRVSRLDEPDNIVPLIESVDTDFPRNEKGEALR